MIGSALEIVVPVLRSPDPSQALVAAKCMGLLTGYDARWRNAPYDIEEVEYVASSDLWNPETQRKSCTFIVSGKIDILARDRNTRAAVLFDHKTTSQDISDPNAPYWRQLAIEGQVDHYMLLEWLNGRKVDSALWDVLRKPGIAPKGIAKSDLAIILQTKRYYHADLSSDDLDALRDTGRETNAMYAARLAYDCTTERPQWYFQRRHVPRLDAEIHQYAKELWDHGQDILAARNSGRHPRNSGACMLYGSPCEFLGVCSGYDDISSANWKQREWVHPELPAGEGRGLELLTNSRIRCFQTCRQKHHFKYEIGIERVDEEERESLFFGDLFHRALEAYFLALKEQQKGVAV